MRAPCQPGVAVNRPDGCGGILFAAKLPVFVEVALDLPRGALGFQIAPRRGEGQESLVIAEQDSLSAFEFALRRSAAGKPFPAALFVFLAALALFCHVILPCLSAFFFIRLLPP